MAGSCTQAGLNTINLNELKLSQQIIVYITATLTTPIFIHGSVLFVRLYWFERYFDDIKESSKLNYKMRRNATLAARTRSTDRTAANTMNNSGLGSAPGGISRSRTSDKLGDANMPQKANTSAAAVANPLLGPQGPSQSSSSEQSKMTSSGIESGQTIYKEPSDGEDVEDVENVENKSDETDDIGDYVPQNDPTALSPTSPANAPPLDGIKFADLPKPSKRTQEIDPSDMYKSIALLQKHKRRDSGLDGDVLVIKSPKEIERDLNTPIFTTRTHHLHFPSSRRTGKWRMGRRSKSKTRWDALKKTISNNTGRKRTMSMEIDQDNDNDSIDSEMHDETALTDANDETAEEISINSAADEAHDDGSIISCNSSHHEEEHVNADTDEELSEKEAPKKSLFQDSHGDNLKTKFAQEPTIDRQKRQARNQGRRRLRKWRTPGVTKLHTRTMTDHSIASGNDAEADDDEDYDDEEDDLDSNGSPLTKVMSTNYLSWTPKIGRNSTFVHLTEEQKEELGGVEYRAIKLLIKINFGFYLGFHVIAFCLYVGFIKVATGYAQAMRDFGISPTWWGFFTAQSVFNDLGLTLTPNSMMTYSRNVYMLVISSFFIVIGNTGFPIFLRFIIWVMFKTARPLSQYKESLGFLLDHPRRCFTLLFPSIPTWWLFFILIVLNATDLVLFIILDLKSDYLEGIPLGFRILDGLFQAFSTRTAGFTVVDLSQLHPAVQVSYMIMMYISVLPLAISIRRTNVYEEQSLGVYLKGDDAGHDIESTPKSFIGTHLRNQLSFDLWFVFLGLFIICIAEGSKIETGDMRFTVFTILFEIISAYGTVGLSLGYPDVDQSFSYRFTTLSKLVMVAMMIRGRHRGLPYSLDRAIMLPDADMQKRDILQENHASQQAGTLSKEPTSTSFNDAASGGLPGRLRRTISRKAHEYRKHSLFPAPTKLPEEIHEIHEMRSMSRNH
ncbi:hypothetical protein JCM33374_g1067 [Metschnikowia sp. JCM 33374]|nr:hypothetical protein JCM33374_g1067 [Metschnikowia sp. JCM 33374]